MALTEVSSQLNIDLLSFCATLQFTEHINVGNSVPGTRLCVASVFS